MRRALLQVSLVGVYSMLSVFASRASASFVFTVVQSGNNVSVIGSGSLNTSALTFDANYNAVPTTLFASEGWLVAGPSAGANASRYFGLSGPSEFGPGRPPSVLLGTGDLVGIIFGSELYVPAGYVSGSYLSDSDVIDGETYSGIGSTPGIYIYTWGSGPTADSLTINIGTVPEPASFSLIAVPVAIAMLRRRRRHLV